MFISYNHDHVSIDSDEKKEYTNAMSESLESSLPDTYFHKDSDIEHLNKRLLDVEAMIEVAETSLTNIEVASSSQGLEDALDEASVVAGSDGSGEAVHDVKKEGRGFWKSIQQIINYLISRFP